jgi:hypothetical protein
MFRYSLLLFFIFIVGCADKTARPTTDYVMDEDGNVFKIIKTENDTYVFEAVDTNLIIIKKFKIKCPN